MSATEADGGNLAEEGGRVEAWCGKIGGAGSGATCGRGDGRSSFSDVFGWLNIFARFWLFF